MWCVRNKEHIKEKNSEWNKSFAGRLSQMKTRNKIRSTYWGKLNHCVSAAINKSLKINYKNGCHWEVLVGYKISELVSHLEKYFADGVSWKNYGHGRGKWCIDHDTPIAYFNYDSSTHPEFRVCWGLNNLYPMWCSENFSKGDKLLWRQQSI